MENPNTVPTDDYKTDLISSEEDNNTNSVMTIAHCSAEDSSLSIDDMKSLSLILFSADSLRNLTMQNKDQLKIEVCVEDDNDYAPPVTLEQKMHFHDVMMLKKCQEEEVYLNRMEDFGFKKKR